MNENSIDIFNIDSGKRKSIKKASIKRLFLCLLGKFYSSSFLRLASFIASPIWLLAVKLATISFSILLPACGAFGNKIKLLLVSSPND